LSVRAASGTLAARDPGPRDGLGDDDEDVLMSKTQGAASATGEAAAKRFATFREIADFLWQNAERLRGAYKPNEYDKVILPLLVARRLDCVLAPTKDKVLARLEALKAKGMKATEPAVDVALCKVTTVPFYNTSKFDFGRLKGDTTHIAPNLRAYLKAFSANARDILEQFKFDEQIARLDEANLLYQVIELFAEVDLHPDVVPNHVMGSVFEELIRRFNEKKNEGRRPLRRANHPADGRPVVRGVTTRRCAAPARALAVRPPAPAAC
jgi:type I restriction enzyme M protein